MFDIGWSELLVIGVVALIAIGPKELPGVLRTVGLWLGKIRRMAAEFQGQFQEAIREAEMADLRKEVESVTDIARNFASGIDNAARIDDPLSPSPPSAPVAEPIPAGPPPPLVTEDTSAPAMPLPAPAEQQALPPPAATPSVTDFHVPPPEPPPPVSTHDFAAPTAPAAPATPVKVGEGGA